jgi:hypothetical protein
MKKFFPSLDPMVRASLFWVLLSLLVLGALKIFQQAFPLELGFLFLLGLAYGIFSLLVYKRFIENSMAERRSSALLKILLVLKLPIVFALLFFSFRFEAAGVLSLLAGILQFPLIVLFSRSFSSGDEGEDAIV